MFQTYSQCPLIALVGRPNVGKSTLFNRLTRTRKAIVDPTPGVTRDRHYQKITWEQREMILIDTGGIELDSNDKIPAMIREQSLLAIEEADIILLLLDARDGLLSEDYEVVEILRRSSKPVYYVVNKIDGPQQEHTLLAPFYELGVKRLWPVSAEHRYGITDFMEMLINNFPAQIDQEGVPEETIRIACIGRPNVGKSSLINRLLGQERLVVSDIPGTTRDAVDTLLVQNGKHYLLIDTAGIRRKGKVSDKIEKFSVMKALSSLEQCDIALLLIDADEGITEQDTKVIGYALQRGRACLVLVNKWDLIDKKDKKKQKWIMDGVKMSTRFAGYAPTLQISALNGFGVKGVLPALEKVYQQYGLSFSTNRINKILRQSVEKHTPPLHRGRRLKLYYTTQVSTKPPTFIIFVNYPKAVHFSYYRFLVNQFREGLGLDLSPVRLLLKERKRTNPYHTSKK